MSQEHGGIDHGTVLADGLHVYDFSANVNPWGYSPLVDKAVVSVKHQYYPDRYCNQLREVVAAHEGVEPDEVLCGNGATELIWAVCRWAKGNKSKANPSVATSNPTFGEYSSAVQRCGLNVHEYSTCADDAFRVNIASFAEFTSRRKPAVTFVCSPNNPTGQVLTNEEIELIERAAYPGYVVLDQAYREYAATEPIRHTNTLLRLCCLTKAYGLAGLRLGYLIGPAETLREIARHIPPWTVSSAAQAAGIAALTDQNWLNKTLHLRRRAAETMHTLLLENCFEITSDGAGFFLVRAGNANEWRCRLYERGFAVRDCTSFGLPDHIRISAAQPDASRLLIAAMILVRQELYD